MQVALAVNPVSGRGKGARAGADAARALGEAGVKVTWLTGDSAADLERRVRAALADGVDALVVAGGDGMVNLGVTLTAGTGLPLGIVAAGTGNDIARELGLPVGDPAEAARVAAAALAAGERLTADAARCTWAGPAGERTRWLGGVLALGFDAIVNERANGWRWPRGRARYVAAMLRELPVFRPREYTLELDGETWRTPGMLVAVGNGPSYGGGMRVTPDASMTDGLLDVMVVEPISRRELLRVFPLVYQGTHVEHPAVKVRRARAVSVAAEGIVGYGDGERFGPLPIRCVTEAGALEVLAPPRARPAGGGG